MPLFSTPAARAGYFQIDDTGTFTNDYAWNKVANMLYMESPAGSGSRSGSSECRKGGKAVACTWDDGSQAEAYAHTLAAFHKAFPEYAKSDLYLTGESYFGQVCLRETPPLNTLPEHPPAFYLLVVKTSL